MGDLGATYSDHLRLVGKRIGDFLLVLIELFQIEGVAPPPTILLLVKLDRMIFRMV